MAPWTTYDFPPLAPSTHHNSSATRSPLGGSRRGGRSGGPRGRNGGGGGSSRSVGPREPNPFAVPQMVEKFDDLQVIEKQHSFDDDKIASNNNSTSIINDNNKNNLNGINFDAYEDIPIEVSGQNVPPAVNTFAEITGLGEALNENIRRCKYVKPTPIQRHAIPIAMAGRDLMACAQTGSGKTAAFCFPIISGILKRGPPLLRSPPTPIPPRYGGGYGGYGGGGGGGGRMACPAALILSPTRELTSQINEEAKKFAYQTGVKVVVAYGGAPMIDQLRKLDKGVDILVATPGRLVDMIERGKVSLRMIKYLAFDEADRMLDMGFEPQIRKIVQQTDMPPPGRRQTLLFSATFPTEIQRLASDFLSNYIFLTVGRVGSSTDLIAQKVEFVHDTDKKKHLMDLLSQKMNEAHGMHALTIVFVETKRGADELEYWLSRNGFPATAIHGDKVQMERERALKSFKTGATPIMVATDVAARGLDIPCVAHVINFDLPREIDNYIHRIGRTGRAGKTGIATAFFNDKNLPIAKALAELMVEAKQEVPSWLTEYAETSLSSGYGGGSTGGRRTRGGKFGGHDYRSFDQYATDYYDYSSPCAGDVRIPQAFGSHSSDVVEDSQAFGTDSSGVAGDSYAFSTDSYVAADSHASPAFGFTHGYESIVATGWD